MQRYDTYKPSGVKWLGEIPSHWEVLPGLAIFKENKERNSNLAVNTVLSLSYGKIVVKKDIDEGLVPAEYNTYQIVHPGYIIIRCTDLQNDKVSLRTGLVKDDGIITGAYLGLVTNGKYNSSFMHYFLHAWDITKEIYRHGNGLRQSLSWLDLRRLPILIPPIAEQTAIANYLDTATAKIDAAIAQQQKMIDLLNERKQIIINRAVTKGLNPNAKMKDSGVEWIGEVPEEWEVKKLGYCIDILPGYAFPSQDFVENGIKLLRGINVSPEKIRWEESVYWNKTIDDTLKKYLLEENDLVLGLDRPWIGSGTRVAIVKEEDLPCLLVQRVCRIRPTNMMSINYIYYLLSNNLFYNALAVDTTGVSVPHISTEQIKKVVIPIPKLSEQNAIVEYIEMHIASINKAIQAANNQISLLQERKQIIINEVVTGKVKVV